MNITEHTKNILKNVGLSLLSLVVAFIIVLGLSKAIPFATSSLASAGASLTSLFIPVEKITLSSDRDVVTSGSEITLSWKHVGKRGAGSYFFEYQCRNGLTLERVNGTTSGNLPCNVRFPFKPTETDVLLVPTLVTKNALVDAIFTIYFKADNSDSFISDKTTVSVQNGLVANGTVAGGNSVSGTKGTTNTATMSTKTNTAPAAPRYVNTYAPTYTTYTGLPDLVVSITSTGIVSGNVFIPKTVVRQGERAAAKILVTNIGTNVSGTWILRANLPTVRNEVFTSDSQRSLAPGESLELTLAFDDLVQKLTSGMSVVVDPNNTIIESNKSNNQAVAYFTKDLATYNYYNGNYNYANYGNYYYNNYADLPDLEVHIRSVGTLNNGVFIPTNYIGRYDRAAVQFDVTNRGGQSTGTYNIAVRLSNGTNVFTSYSQPSLAPGETATFTSSFDGNYNGQYNQYYGQISSNIITVTATPNNGISENNTWNNSDTVTYQVGY